MKKAILLISIIVLETVYIGYWQMYERKNLVKTIEELNKGAQIDYKYTNEIDLYAKGIYSAWESCNSTLSDDLQGKLTDSQITLWIDGYKKLVQDTADTWSKIMKTKEDRHNEFATFKYAKVYKPTN